jgi:hypothetical protein
MDEKSPVRQGDAVSGLPGFNTEFVVDRYPQNAVCSQCNVPWFARILDIDAFEDSQAIAENLKLQAAHGIKEAAEPPIVSSPVSGAAADMSLNSLGNALPLRAERKAITPW